MPIDMSIRTGSYRGHRLVVCTRVGLGVGPVLADGLGRRANFHYGYFHYGYFHYGYFHYGYFILGLVRAWRLKDTRLSHDGGLDGSLITPQACPEALSARSNTGYFYRKCPSAHIQLGRSSSP